MSPPKANAIAGIDAPSVVGRALLAIALLVGFYLLTLGVAVVLLLVPVVLAWTTGLRNLRLLIFAFAICWIPAFLLFLSMFDIRRAPFTPKGRRLAPEEAPELFAILSELARAASTEPPSEVYLTDRVDLSVTETAGLFGKRGHRILSIGAPVLAWTTVEELRAGLAHELGHFAFGDTRLLGLVSYAHAAFRAVLENTERAPFADSGISSIEAGFAMAKGIGDALVENYAKFFFWLTRKSDRRAELAADQLAGRLVGSDAAIRLLEKFSVAGPLYDVYLDQEVGFALAAGGLPIDLTAGFAAFSARLKERGVTKEIEEAVRKETTSFYDAHPALTDRVEALRRVPLTTYIHDPRSAAALVALDLDAWLVSSVMTNASVRGVAPMRWADMPRAVFAPHCMRQARETAAQLFSLHPEASTLTAMFATIVRSLGEGRLESIAHYLEPELASVPPHLRWQAVKRVGARTINALFSGALLERGAEIDVSLGEPSLVFRLQGTPVAPGDLASRSIDDAEICAALQRWAASLEEASRRSTSPAPFDDPRRSANGISVSAAG